MIPILLLWPFSSAIAPLPWPRLGAALGLFVLGVFTDYLDGRFARSRRLETPFGRILDPAADKVLILATMTAFAVKGVYSYWLLVPIILREAVITFCRSVWFLQGKAVGAERAGKVKFGLQVASVMFSFLYLAIPLHSIFYLNYLFLILALALTLYSGFFFLWNNRSLLADKNFAASVAAVGVGYWKPIPGTYGSLLGLLFVPLIAHDVLLHALIFFFFLGLAYLAIPRMGLSDEEDPHEVVIDEVCGMLLSFVGVAVNWRSLLIGFLLFRFFDVVKIFPLRWLEKKRGVHGIMLDDLGAAAYTWLILKLLFP